MAHATLGRFNVVSGPSKFDLMLSTFERKVVQFQLRQPGTSYAPQLNMIVLGTTQEDGSCENWNLTGYVTDGPMKSVNFSGFYTTKNRSGTFELRKAS